IAQGYLPQAAIDAGAAEPADADHHPLWWVEQMLFALYRRELQADIDAMQRRPRLVERGMRA
ncbi:MAG TPA: hypothetical protein VFB99_24355, partial [Vicinamibacterales bacterium]|nr:hypothetical protein [Vicinamibacterales bacterium]